MREGPQLIQLLTHQRSFFATGKTLDLDFRRQQLRKILQLLERHETEILTALYQDLRKPPHEAYAAEIATLKIEIKSALRHLTVWARPRRANTPIFAQLGHAHWRPVPYGQVLIISPWNYPFQLALAPLVAALAAGNVVVLKPSEMAPATSRLLVQLLGDNFTPELISVVPGDAAVARQLLAHQFDHIFFTGSPQTGREVMRQASEYLTPVTLELGGKSPAIVTESAHLKTAARRLVWGKFFNAGQTCIAPDFLWIHESMADSFIHLLATQIREFYGAAPSESPDLARVINEKHFDRLRGLMTKGRIRIGGQADRETLYISPTVIDQVDFKDPIMQEEIFGPLLPVITYQNVNDVIEAQQRMPSPLALYVFATDEATIHAVTERISFGGGCVNDTLVHAAIDQLPFGGVGQSGMGRYHGEAGFLTFSQQKSLVSRSNWPDLSVRYPPYSQKKMAWLRRFLG